MRSPTEKQCPGCKTQQRFYTGDVCYTCEQKIKNYASTKAALDLAMGDRPTCKVHFGEYLPVPLATVSLESAAGLSRALANLVRALVPNYKPEIDPEAVKMDRNYAWNTLGASKMSLYEGCRMPVHNSDYDMSCVATVPKEFGPAYNNMVHQLGQVIREAERRGQVRGQDLLMQLNEGDLSLNDFNDRLARAQSGR